jgi:hypothetical protein
MDTAALRSWSVKPNFSDGGNEFVTLYIEVQKPIALSQK